jgi:hypothetical protein
MQSNVVNAGVLYCLGKRAIGSKSTASHLFPLGTRQFSKARFHYPIDRVRCQICGELECVCVYAATN